MNAFWRWLLRANARMVFLCLLALLCAVSGWWAWKEFGAPVPKQTLPSSGEPTAPDPLRDPVVFLTRQQQVPAEAYAGNPFAGAFSPKKRVTHSEPSTKARYKPMPRTRRPRARRKQKPSLISLTYRGMIVRPDGRAAALIEDRASGRSSFYDAGSVLYGFRIGAIEFSRVLLDQGDGSKIPLELGKARTFVEETSP